MTDHDPTVLRAQRWNHNIHYHPVVLGALSAGCGRVLDVLPGVQYRRHILWRYSLVWRKPAD